jgi:hypothetical protein
VAKIDVIEFGILFADVDNAKEYLDDLKSPTYQAALTELIDEWPFTVTVDREVWYSINRHQGDKCVVTITVKQPQLDGDTLEDLADSEESVRIKAARAVLDRNAFEADLIRLH